MTLPLWTAALLVILLATVGSIIQRVSGFGFGIFVMMFLPHIIGSYGEANALSGLLSLISCAAVAFSLLRFIDWKNLIFPGIGYALLSLPAIIFMTTQPDNVLFIMLGAVLILLSVYFMLFSEKVRLKPTWYGGLISGGLSGIMGGLFAMGGPPVVVYYVQSENGDNRAYLATIQMYFVLTNAYGTTVKAFRGLVTLNVLILCACGLAGLFAGLLIGKKIFNRLNPKTLRRIVYGVMAVSGVVNIVNAII